eukprot:CFRG7630T1
MLTRASIVCTKPSRVAVSYYLQRPAFYSSATAPLDEPIGVIAGAPLPNGLPVETKVEISTLSNGLKVASLENYGATSAVGLVTGAGSRYESSANRGVSSLNRQMAFKSTDESTQFSVVRELEHLGARLTSSTSREYATTQAVASRDNLSTCVDVLADDFKNRLFLGWEITQAKNEMKIQSANEVGNGAFQVIEAVHAASFQTGGLGKPLTPASYQVASLSAKSLSDFSKAAHVTSNSVLVGVGCQHNELVSAAEAAFAGAKSGAKAELPAAKFTPSDVRVSAGGSATYIAVGFEGKAINSAEAPIIAVIQHALGAGNGAKWGTSQSYLARKLSSVMKTPATLVAFNASYSDTGLVGIVGGAANADVGCVAGLIKDVVAEIGSKGLSDEDIEAGKASLAASVTLVGDDASLLIEDIGAQVTLTGSYTSPTEAAAKIAKISAADVNKVAKAIFSSKPSVGAYGETSEVPHF